MAPTDDPKLLMYVAVQQPHLDVTETGAAPVSQIFTTVMKSSLQYLHIEPNGEKRMKAKTAKPQALDSWIGQPAASAAEQLKEKGYVPVVIGRGKYVEQQLPQGGDHVLLGERVVLKTDGAATMPDLRGFSLRDAMKVAHILGLRPSTKGTGYVVSQNIRPGAEVRKGDYLIVELAPPRQWEKAAAEKEKEAALRKEAEPHE
ncbi:hypothetical protein DI43_04275 [Geobacillus sp. CAMR12739]|nr:hypothetical protein DI43_04275 [Geobacillus sp. CAMR12739]